MEPKRIRPIEDRESQIQQRIIDRLRVLRWFVKPTHGNEFQSGFPDLFAAHQLYGSRWIEVKRPSYPSFTEAQLRDFPLLSNNGSGIWVLTGEDDFQINRLFAPQNWVFSLPVMRYKMVVRERKPREAKESRAAASGPEWEIQMAIKAALEADQWFIKSTNGNIWQYGFPDLYATHKRYGHRWIEVKNPTGYSFTPAQIATFPALQAAGVGVWIMTDPSQVDVLFRPGNWRSFL